MQALFGDTLMHASSDKLDTLVQPPSTGVVGLYFSAHWCGPCRMFTPRLIENYKKIKENGKDFEVIFVSSDRDEDSFKSYYKEMPWMGLPFASRDLKAKLSKKFKVQGIPSLVLIDAATGKLITKDGRSALTKDSTGEKYPWKPKAALECLGEKLIKNDGTEMTTADAIKDKYTAIYFSAHWCPPCKKFTPMLSETYKKLKDAGKNIEVVFASEDQDEGEFQEYFKTMPFLAIPYDNREAVQDLSATFEVSGIPTMVVLGPDGKVVQSDACTALRNDPEGNDFPWAPKPVQDIETAAEHLNETTAIVAFAEDVDEAEQKEIEAALRPVSEEAIANADKLDEEPELLCMISTKQDGAMGKRVKELCKVKAAAGKATMVLLDLSDNGAYYHWDGSGKIDTAAVKAFLAKYKNKELERQSLA
jgi:nucleoredoxin